MKTLDPTTLPLFGTSLIEASAGTGKTYTLTTLYLRLIVEQRLRPAEILVVTYTNAATGELRERVRGRLLDAIEAGRRAAAGAPLPERDPESERWLRALAAEAARDPAGDSLRRALAAFDEAAIFTIHGFCQRTLQEHAFESGMPFDAELVEQSKPLEQTLAHDLFRRLLADEDASFVRWLVDGPGKKWNFSPQPLYGALLRKLGADEDMPVVPAVPDAAAQDPGPLFAATADARRRWAATWRADREAVARLLLEPNGMNGNKYQPASIEKNWLPAFDEMMRTIEQRGDDDSAVAAVALGKGFEKLATSAVAKGANKGKAPIEHPAFDAFEAVCDTTDRLATICEARALSLRLRFVELARAASARRRDALHLYFFDDLLSEVRRALRGLGGPRLAALLRERYRVALIDEFQDTDPVQYDVFREVWHSDSASESRGLVLIGDPKQAIYSFRGADVHTYLAAQGDAGPSVHGLAQNWRSDPGLIAAVNALFSGPATPFRLEAIEFAPVRPRPDVAPEFDPGTDAGAGLRVLMLERAAVAEAVGCDPEESKKIEIRDGRPRVVDGIARDVARRLESGARVGADPLVPSDIAILCRRKSEIQRIREALEALSIPCVDRGEADVFESREAWELSSVMQAMRRPADPARLRAALSTAAHGLGASDLAELEDDSPALATVSERYAEYGRLWSQIGFGRAFETWRRDEGVTARLLALRDGERRITNWLHLAELLQRFAGERRPSRGGLVAALDRAIGSAEARSIFGGDASLLRLERDDRAVQLLTLHGSKGLEYPIVYLPFLWEDPDPRGGRSKLEPVRFHDAETGLRTLDLAASDPSRRAAAAETFAEELRLVYVGITRARHQCVIAWGRIGDGAQKSPLARLLLGSEGDGLSDAEAIKALAGWKDDEWKAAWERIGRAADASVAVEALDLAPRGPWRAEAPPSAPLVEPPPVVRFRESVRTTSFSGLTREGHSIVSPVVGPETLGRDLDGGVTASGDAPETREVEASAGDLHAEMASFPRGAEAGTLLHSALEEVDFARWSPEAREARRGEVEQLLERSAMETAWVEPVLQVIDAVASTPLRLEPSPFRLGDLRGGGLLPEMEFTLATPGGRFTPRALADVLASAPKGSPLADYAPRAARLGFPALHGFLRGFVDAVFHDGERYCLIDYKSNYLGARQADYAPDALVAPMIDHDYVLQYLLYTVALDRHLAACVERYDYDRDFGGVYYLFLRGFAPGHTPLCGVFHDRPPRSVVEAVGALMGLAIGERA